MGYGSGNRDPEGKKSDPGSVLNIWIRNTVFYNPAKGIQATGKGL
jgi:hypothetical protein